MASKSALHRLLPVLVLLLLWGGRLSAQGDSVLHIVAPPDIDALNAQLRAQTDPNALVYAKATALGDHQTAITALHYLLLGSPGNRFLEDSLAALYYRVGNLDACRRWCDELLSRRPDDLFLHQLLATIAEGRGDYIGALTHVEQLYAGQNSLYWRYRLAGLQYQVGRYGECTAHVGAMLSDPAVDAESLRLSWDGGTGIVPMRAALVNLRGNLELATGKEALAQKSFREALKLAPEFGLARNNLSALQAKYHNRANEHGGN